MLKTPHLGNGMIFVRLNSQNNRELIECVKFVSMNLDDKIEDPGGRLS